MGGALRIVLGVLCVAVALAAPSLLHAGAFITASESSPNVIMHPIGYTGSQNSLTIDVCVISSSPNADQMEVAAQRVVDTWNALVPTAANLSLGSGNDIPPGNVDFESVLLHELGHCGFGLAHPNLASESGLLGEDREFTKSGNGPDNVFDTNAGPDAEEGSADDNRDDDQNLHWSRDAVGDPGRNDPFDTTLPVTIDSTTYSRNVADLPAGEYAVNADRDVAALPAFGYGNTTEAVMQQGTFTDEAQRTLGADDVATAELGMSGVNMTDGDGDDYTVTFNYVGQASSCDIEIDFDDVETEFAECQTSWFFINATHRRIFNAEIYFNTGFNWFFAAECGDGVIAGEEECDDGGTAPGDGCDDVCEIESGWQCAGAPSVCTEDCGDGLIVGSETCDDGGTSPGDGCDASCQEEPGWSCTGQPSSCSEVCGDTMVVGTEQCDDGGTLPGDCCDALCMFEANGSPCDADGNACTDPDTCDGAGTCNVGPVLDCNDSNVCTDDSCDPGSGCTYVNNTLPCSDGSACTDPDVCSGGACVPGPPLDCDDSNECTDDSCDPGSGCVNTNNNDPCDADGTACTDPDLCSGGACVAGPVLDCDDADACTADSCDAVLGCVNEPIPFCAASVPTSTPWARALLAAMLAAAAGLLLTGRRGRV